MLSSVKVPESPPNYAPMSLLREIVENPTLRAELESNPVAAFAKHGVEISGHNSIELPKASDVAQFLGDSDGGGTLADALRWKILFG